ncbi:hypothetical protein [Aureimonas jatrophae]|uniref:Uncharacterized protein n=1 Tax=Aureimonas jatrophae TaxID=1166073 RepID=A0A1H0M5N8_9HYPH|nr:hypothetical protein [Aureimonas jatrophae]MBB3952615.1 hypothetical protein [Aureimonas jatrophae]SDO75685.1 hypothetical protein SAMN05192530_11277 [Aureimonas jatrophae]
MSALPSKSADTGTDAVVPTVGSGATDRSRSRRPGREPNSGRFAPVHGRPRSAERLEGTLRRAEASGLYRVLRRVERAHPVPTAAGRLVLIVQGDASSPRRGCRDGGAALLATHDGLRLTDVVATFADDPQGSLPFDACDDGGTTTGHRPLDGGALDAFGDRIDLVVSHDAEGAKPSFVHGHPALAGLAWTSSRRDVPWSHYDTGDGIENLLLRLRLFGPMRSPADACAALFSILSSTAWPSTLRSPLGMLLDAARNQIVELVATGPTFSLRDGLKSRGWRWNPADKTWSVRLPEGSAAFETAWVLERLHPLGGSVRMHRIVEAVSAMQRDGAPTAGGRHEPLDRSERAIGGTQP